MIPCRAVDGSIVKGHRAGHMLAECAFDAGWLRKSLSEHGVMPVISPRKKRKPPAAYDKEMCKWRHRIENFFPKVKDYRGIATRCCKTDSCFKAFISRADTVLWIK